MPHQPTINSLELKVPPVVVFLIFVMAMWSAAGRISALAFSVFWSGGISAVFVIGGIIITKFGLREFQSARTTVNPTKPNDASALVTSGIYQFSRNPMYLGMLCILAGWAIFLSDGLSAILLTAFVLYMNRFQIIPEERALASNFGDAYLKYKQSVRRWL